MDYLSLPFVLDEGRLERATVQESITYSIGLLISTRQGIMKSDPDFGCDVWNKEFSDLYSANKADIRASLRNAINKYEGRLYNVSVSFESVQDQQPHTLGLTVKVSGNFKDGNEEKKFEARYLLG